MKKNTILIVGSSGLLGANLALELMGGCTELHGIVLKNCMQVDGFKLHRVDIRQKIDVTESIRTIKPRCIINAAALTNVDVCESKAQDASLLNEKAAVYIAEAAAEIGAHLIQISTDSVYSGGEDLHKETEEPKPVNVYAQTKLNAENRLRCIPGLTWTILRTNFFGWNAQNKTHLAEWILRMLETGKTVSGFQDIKFSPLLVNHLAGIVKEVIDKRVEGLYNLGCEGACSKYQFACNIAEIFGYDSERIVPIRVAEKKFSANRPLNTAMDSHKIASVLNVVLPTWGKGIQDFFGLRQNGYTKKLKKMIKY